MRPEPADAGTIGDVWRREAPHVLAALARRGARFEDCEDAAQEALLAATTQWPSEGLPANPRGWLVRVASRRLVDQQRSAVARDRRELADARASGIDRPAHWADRAEDRDDTLQLLLLCAHPALGTAAAVALTLRAVAGLTTEQVADVLLLPRATAAQRISRAKASLRVAGARFGEVTADDLPRRLHAVRHVLHLVFTAGSSLSSGPELVDHGLTGEAIRLTEQLHRALPRDPETAGLLALMLLVQARAATRVHDGTLVPLSEQDRSRWDRDAIERGVALLEAALPHGPVGPFQLQAAIAAVHATAPDVAGTDWPQVLELYRMLQRVAPGPAVDLGAAIATSEVDGPEAGLEALEPLLAADPDNHRVLAARAHLLERLGDPASAVCYRQAAALTDSLPERRYLLARAGESSGQTLPPPAAGD